MKTKFFTLNKDNKIEFTEKELKALLDEIYNDGYWDGKRQYTYVYNTPHWDWNKVYYTTTATNSAINSSVNDTGAVYTDGQNVVNLTNVDGETTALYLAKILEEKHVNVTRLAYGLPMGGNLDYADALTLAKAIEGRRKI